MSYSLLPTLRVDLLLKLFTDMMASSGMNYGACGGVALRGSLDSSQDRQPGAADSTCDSGHTSVIPLGWNCVVTDVLGSGAIWLERWAGQAGDPFDFAQGRLFAAPEKRLRSG